MPRGHTDMALHRKGRWGRMVARERPRFGVDLDGVCFNWDDPAERLCFKLWAINLPESTHWDFIEQYLGEERWEKLWDKGLKLGLFRGEEGLTYHGTQEALKALGELGDVCFITSRPCERTHVREDTLRYLADLGVKFR